MAKNVIAALRIVPASTRVAMDQSVSYMRDRNVVPSKESAAMVQLAL